MRHTLLIIAFIVLLLSPASSQWQRSVSPYEANVQQLIVDDTVLVAWGYGGLFRSSDRGETWNGVESLPLNIYVPTMLKTSAGTYLIVTTDTLRRSTDQGVTWNNVSVTLSKPSVKKLLDAGNGVLLHDQSRDGLSRSTDDGITWERVLTNFIDSNLTSVARHGSTILAGFKRAGLWQSTDEGVTWNKVSTFSLSYGVTSLLVRGDTIYAGIVPSGGQNYGAAVSYDGGATWQLLNKSLLSFNSVISMVWYRNSVYGVLEGGPLLYGPVARLVDGQWISPALSHNTLQLINDNDRLYAATDKDGIWYKPYPDTSFRSLNIGLHRDISIIHYVDTDSGLLAVAYSGLFASTDEGATWRATGEGLASKFTAQYNHGLARYKGKIYCTVDKGVMISSNGGTSWDICRGELATTSVYGDLLALDTMLLVATSNGVFKFAKDGLTGTPLGLGLLYKPVNALAEHDGTLFAGTDQEGPWRSTNGGATWIQATAGYDAGRVWKFFTIASQLYASSDTATFRWVPATSNWVVDDLGFDTNIRLWAVHETNGAIFAAVSRLGEGYNEIDRSLYMSQDGARTWSDVAGDRLRGVSIYALKQVGEDLLAGTYHYGTWHRPLGQMTNASSGIEKSRTASRKELALRIQPSPASDRATLSFALSHSQHLQCILFDARGNEVARLYDGWCNAGEFRIDIDAGSIPSGIYFCRAIGEGASTIVPLVIAR